VSRYDWLLFLHLLSAFALVAALVAFTTLFATVRGADAPLLRISWLASRLWEVGGLGTLVFGVWMAIDLDNYDILDGWIVAALVLWFVASGAGSRVVMAYTQARAGELSALRSTRFTSQHVVMIVATTLLLVDMIFKPGV
jgi:uncharacterized membrane protein